MKRIAVFSILLILGIISRAQSGSGFMSGDSCTMEISLLTCAPGTDLYSLFGHTAVRVRDSRRGMDIVYNYGTFDDTDPMFYIKFMRGIMRYSLAAETYGSFMQEYEYEHRAVGAQVLNLTCKEKNNLYEALRKNTLDENRFYDYHFHTDNCTTRAGRIIESNTTDPLIYKNILRDTSRQGESTPVNLSLTFRDMIHEYLRKQNAYWSEFGIDLFLGSNLDKKVTNVEAIHFLPDYLRHGMDSAYAGEKKLVSEKYVLLGFPDLKTSSAGITPFLFFLGLLILTIVLFLLRGSPGLAKSLLIFDFIFFAILGLLGLLMAAMWVGRVDDVCSNNINILWAIPTHIFAVFFLRKKYTWVKYYFLTTAILAMILVIGYPWWLQRMDPPVLPILGIVIFRGIHLFQVRNHAEKLSLQR